MTLYQRMMRRKVKLSRRTVLERVCQESVFKHYISRSPSEGMTTNPLREDKKAGCTFKWSEEGILTYCDWAKEKSYDIFEITKVKFNLNFRESLVKIDCDFNLGILEGNPIPIRETFTKESTYSRKLTTFAYQRQEFREHELEYWKRYGVTKETLEVFNVYSISSLSKFNRTIWKSTKSQPIYQYFFPSSDSSKFYRPNGKPKHKWRNACGRNEIQGYAQLPFSGKTLIITSSLKDVMVLYEMGYPAIAPNSETSFLPEAILNECKGLFDRLVIMFDNDETGIKQAKKYSEKYDLEYILPQAKDISDSVIEFGFKPTFNNLQKQLNNGEK